MSMPDSLAQVGLSNALFSLGLALLAMAVGLTARRPRLAHLLWVLVLLKLVVPPLLTLPVSIFSVPSGPAVTATEAALLHGVTVVGASGGDAEVSPVLSGIAALAARVHPWLAAIWLPGSLVVLVWSLIRVVRFGRLLATESRAAPQSMQTAAVEIARRLRLQNIPSICTTSARLSPMVWWAGGKVRIVLPTTLLDHMDEDQRRWILAHELAHVQRRDYLVRWLEWLACVCFWWNPVVWWAQRSLRAAEEICCDDVVLSCLKPRPHAYASSLLTAVEFLACPVLRPPAMASEINSGGHLERRIRMIVSEHPNRTTARWVQAVVLLCAVVVLPLGMAFAQDYDAVAKQLKKSVKKGEITEQQADAMLTTLKKTGQREKGKVAWYEADEARIRQAVADGQVSAEDARARLQETRKAMAGQSERGTKHIAREDYGRIEADVKKAVAAGKLSEEDARAKLTAILKRIAVEGEREREEQSRRFSHEEYARAENRIKEMVGAGEVSAEHARIRLREMRQAMADQDVRERGQDEPDWGAIEQRIEGAVKSGRITREEADAHYRELKGQSGGEDRRADEMSRLEERVRAAVRDGKMTREQAREKLEGQRRRLETSGRGDDQQAKYEQVSKRIRAAVESGALTEEDAKKKLAALRERMGKE